MVRFSSKFLVGLFPAIVLGCSGSHRQEANPPAPNVILILADDLGYGDLSICGQKSFSTPNIDRLAQEGIRFTNMYCGSTVCAPSRASLMTGKHTGHTSVRGNMPAQLMGDDELTIAKVFKNAGYVTGAIGKWGIGHPPPPDDPQRKGFDYFYGYINMWHAHNFYPEFLYENGHQVSLNNKLQQIDGKNPWSDTPEGTGVADIKNEYVHNLFDARALNFIEQNKNHPFFLYMAYNVPHANNEKKPDGMEVPGYGKFKGQDWPDQEKGFASMIANLDNSVKIIMDKLEELHLDNNTLVIFCSDNGPHQEGGHLAEFFNSNGSYRGTKRDFYDGGVRTPFLALWPDAIQPGQVSDHLAAFWDFLPTFSELTGSEKPAQTDGISFLNTLIGKKQNEKHNFLYWEFFELGGKQAILKGKWKAIRLNVREIPEKQVFELYDLENDPGETNNVAESHPLLVKEFMELFVTAREEFSVTPLLTKDSKNVETPF
jgi:arylsulfatase A-like enzyme